MRADAPQSTCRPSQQHHSVLIWAHGPAFHFFVTSAAACFGLCQQIPTESPLWASGNTACTVPVAFRADAGERLSISLTLAHHLPSPSCSLGQNLTEKGRWAPLRNDICALRGSALHRARVCVASVPLAGMPSWGSTIVAMCYSGTRCACVYEVQACVIPNGRQAAPIVIKVAGRPAAWAALLSKS